MRFKPRMRERFYAVCRRVGIRADDVGLVAPNVALGRPGLSSNTVPVPRQSSPRHIARRAHQFIMRGISNTAPLSRLQRLCCHVEIRQRGF